MQLQSNTIAHTHPYRRDYAQVYMCALQLQACVCGSHRAGNTAHSLFLSHVFAAHLHTFLIFLSALSFIFNARAFLQLREFFAHLEVGER